MSGPVSQIKNLVRKSRYFLLAGTMLSTLALPQWSAASDASSARSGQGTIIVAQGGSETDPSKKGDAKGKQGPQPKGGPPPQGGQPKQGAQPQPKQGAQPQPKQGAQPQPREGAQPQPKQGAQPQPKQGAQPQPKEGAQPQPKQGAQPQPKQGAQPRRPQGKALNQQPKQGAPPQPKGQQKLQKGGPQPKQGSAQHSRSNKAQPQPKQGARPQPKETFQPAPKQGAQPQPKGAQGQPKTFQPQPRQGLGNFGNVDQLRSQRRERVEAGGRRVIDEPGGRSIVRENGRVFIRHDDSERFRGSGVVERRGAERFTTYRRPDGVEIITVTDANGRLLRRIRRGLDRREVVLIDNRPRGTGGFFLDLAPPVVRIPRERYIVDVSEAAPEMLYETLEAPPLEPIDRAYSLDEIRYNVALRDRMRRVDINTITFDTGSSEVTPDQARNLEAIAAAIMRVVSGNPNEVFLIEGHTDAVGSDDDNLSLSDRRAAAVADILSNNYQVPPENLVTQGYGEQNLKVPTDGPSRENRRVTARRITPLLKGAAQ